MNLKNNSWKNNEIELCNSQSKRTKQARFDGTYNQSCYDYPVRVSDNSHPLRNKKGRSPPYRCPYVRTVRTQHVSHWQRETHQGHLVGVRRGKEQWGEERWGEVRRGIMRNFSQIRRTVGGRSISVLNKSYIEKKNNDSGEKQKIFDERCLTLTPTDLPIVVSNAFSVTYPWPSS